MENTKECSDNRSLYHLQGNGNILNEVSEFGIQKDRIVRFLNNQFQNKNLNIFIGSGCSTPIVPLMGKTINSIISNEDNAKIKVKIEDYIALRNKNVSMEDALNLEHFGDIEGFLTWLAKGIDFEKDDDVREEYKNIYNSLKRQFIDTIPKINDKNYNDSPTTVHYENFYKYVFEKRKADFPKLNVFTTNYDFFNEYALEKHGVHYTTGFNTGLNQKFNINCFNYRLVDSRERYKDRWQPTSKEANLYKLHGSINWVEINGTLLHANKIDEDIKSVVIYPTVLKHQETRQSPYSELFREFSIQLQKPNSTLIVLGYGFGDDHINNIISQNLSNADFTLIVIGNICENGLSKFNQINKSFNFHILGGITNSGIDYNNAHYFSEIVKHFCKCDFQEDKRDE